MGLASSHSTASANARWAFPQCLGPESCLRCLCVCHSRGVCVCVILGVAVLCVCCVVCGCVVFVFCRSGRLGSSADLAARPTWERRRSCPSQGKRLGRQQSNVLPAYLMVRLLHRPCSRDCCTDHAAQVPPQRAGRHAPWHLQGHWSPRGHRRSCPRAGGARDLARVPGAWHWPEIERVWLLAMIKSRASTWKLWKHATTSRLGIHRGRRLGIHRGRRFGIHRGRRLSSGHRAGG